MHRPNCIQLWMTLEHTRVKPYPYVHHYTLPSTESYGTPSIASHHTMENIHKHHPTEHGPSRQMPVRWKKCGRTICPRLFLMHIIATTFLSSQFLLFDCLTDSTNQNTSFLQANTLRKSIHCFPSPLRSLWPLLHHVLHQFLRPRYV
jgi:hypothetical protein